MALKTIAYSLNSKANSKANGLTSVSTCSCTAPRITLRIELAFPLLVFPSFNTFLRVLSSLPEQYSFYLNENSWTSVLVESFEEEKVVTALRKEVY